MKNLDAGTMCRALMIVLLLLAFIPGQFALTGCEGESGKGEEVDIPENYEGKFDSFFHPTDHGVLIFGTPLDAELKENEWFHVWNFTLNDQATVDLRIDLITPNVDTVMYLYRRNPESGLWGSYIAKNDDAEGTVASRLTQTLDAALYRVLVKGYKPQIRGRFRLNGTCEGAGCPTLSCDPEIFDGLPSGNTGPGTCGERMSFTLDSSIESSGSTDVTIRDRCSLMKTAATAVDYYYSYWNDLAGWEEFEPDPDYEPLYMEVEWVVLASGGMLVGVDSGYDESAMDFVFDSNGNLVSYYQHNQSPVAEFYCETAQEYFDEECVAIYLDAMPHARNAEQPGSGSGVTGEAMLSGGYPEVAYLAYEEYLRELALPAETAVDIEYVAWENDYASVSWSTAAQVTVKASGQEMRIYELAKASTTQWLFTAGDGSTTTMPCREL